MLANLIRRPEKRTGPGSMSWPDYQNLWEMFGFNGVQYMTPAGTLGQMTALQAVRNPIILACIVIRLSTFAEISFAFQNRIGGRAGRNLFGTPALGILEEPWPGGCTGDLLGRMEIDASMYGNSYWWKSAPNVLTWLDPTRMKILTGDVAGPSGGKVGSTLLAYQLQDKHGQPEETFLPSEIVHYRPIPDPDHAFRGLSWLSALLPDITTDHDMVEFKHSFLKNSATPNLVVQFTNNIGQDAFNAFRDKMETSHVGPSQAFRTLYLGSGADVKTVGSNWSDMELFATQSYGETRLCVAAGVPASMVGIAEGLKGATLNAGNYSATRRRFSDVTMRPLWRMACSALTPAVAPVPAGARLWYEDRDVTFLQADMQDAASTRQSDANTILQLINSGFDPASVRDAVAQDDFTQLKPIPKLTSVQLQPIPDPDADPADDPTDEPAASGDDGGTDDQAA